MKALQKTIACIRNTIIIAAVAISTTSAFAHTTLQSSNPTANAKVTAPKNLKLSFGEPVMLMGLTLTDAKQNILALSFRATSDMKKSYVIELPTLAKSTYTVKWTIMGDDGHNMSGQYKFTVK